MSEKIEPALTPEEWAKLLGGGMLDGRWVDGIWKSGGVSVNSEYTVPLSELPGAIAIFNAALPDSDPRKITREDVALLRDMPEWVFPTDTLLRLESLARRLESYLPPEK